MTKSAATETETPDGVGLKNALDIQWDCKESRVILVSAFLPHNMQRPDSQWCMDAFELEKPLYKGTASLVYAAVDKLSSATVVLKLYRKNKLSGLNRFQVEREILLHSRLRHDHIIVLFAAFEDSKYVYLVQEHAEKGDLFGNVKENSGSMEEKHVVQNMLHPFLLSLQYLHSMSIIHRDIKPENIFVTQDETIKIADFGLSIDEAVERPVTRAGTLDYMAPEVLHCPNKVYPEDNKQNRSLVYNSKVDVWGAGILAYELITGAPPFENESRSTTYHQIMHQSPEFPPQMSPACQDFIKAALQKNSKQRPTVETLLEHPWILQNIKSETSNIENSPSAVSTAEPEEEGIDFKAGARTTSSEAKGLRSSSIPEHSEDLRDVPTASDERAHEPDTWQWSSASSSLELLKQSSAEGDTSSGSSSSRLSTRRIFSLDSVERTPSLPASRFTKLSEPPSATDDLKLKNMKQSLTLVHQVFSKKEEEGSQASPEILKTLNRLPSYSFFPTDKQKTSHPAHRLNRELRGTQNSFTEKVLPKGASKARSPPLVRFQLEEEAPPPVNEKKGRRLSFLQFRKRK